MSEELKPVVLCVDDEPQVLSGLTLLLRRQFEVLSADSGSKALTILDARRDVQVIISDMRMPGMDGAAFLKQARVKLPDAQRILLTGHADLDSAVTAINEGQIFRFLIKPCPQEMLLETLQAALTQYRLINAERILLGDTLNGTIKVLVDVLAMASPKVFGYASRIKQLAGELAQRILPQYRWALEMTAMLSPLGAISLPDEVVDKAYGGQPLGLGEKRMVEKAAMLTESLLAHIPRLDLTRAILARLQDENASMAPFQLSKEEATSVVRHGADILRVALDFDELDASAYSPIEILGKLKARPGRYDPSVLLALEDVCNQGYVGREVHSVSLANLRPGMIIVADVKATNGTLLIARGFEVTASLLQRLNNLRPGTVVEPIRVRGGMDVN